MEAVQKVFIEIKNDSNNEHLLELKRDMEKELGKQNVQIQVPKPEPGQMGAGLSNILTAALDKNNISKIKTFIANFTKLKKVEMTLVNSKGEKLQLNASMDKEVLYMLLNGFFERTLVGPEAILQQTEKQKNTQNAKEKTSKPKKLSKPKSKALPKKKKTNSKKSTTKKTTITPIKQTSKSSKKQKDKSEEVKVKR